MDYDVDCPILWLDIDGCFADFSSGARRLGIDLTDPGYDKGALWRAISEQSDFWLNLPKLPGARRLWESLRIYNPVFLTAYGGSFGVCAPQKERWLAEVLGANAPCVVVQRAAKPHYARPGDVLVDDNPDTIAAWQAAGGIGVVHRNVGQTLRDLAEIGFGAEGLSAEFRRYVEELRSKPPKQRDGYTGYALKSESRRALLQAFPPRLAGPSTVIACDHITRSMPAGHDVVLRPRPAVEVVGEFLDRQRGCHALVVEVDGQVLRKDGDVYHVTICHDLEGGAKQSRFMLKERLEAAGGDVAALRNLSSHQRVKIAAEFALIPSKNSKRKPALRSDPETSQTLPYRHSSGEWGSETVRVKGVQQSFIYKDSEGRLHAEDGEPAIRRIDQITGKTLFEAFYLHGKAIGPEAPGTGGPPTAAF